MSILTLSVGLMRKMSDNESESKIAKCKNLLQLRKAAESQPDLIGVVLDSIAPVELLLSDIITRLQANLLVHTLLLVSQI